MGLAVEQLSTKQHSIGILYKVCISKDTPKMLHQTLQP